MKRDMVRTNITLDRKIHDDAIAQGINISGTSARAIARSLMILQEFENETVRLTREEIRKDISAMARAESISADAVQAEQGEQAKSAGETR
jgi:post-segregation antitoxin (ccd killing protein)